MRTIKIGAVSLEHKEGAHNNTHLNNEKRAQAVCDSYGHAFPTLLILGGQKCGSTSLFYDTIDAFPALIKASPHRDDPLFYRKEVHFFDKPERYAQGAELYGSYWPHCDELRRQGRIPVDGTPDYFLSGFATEEHVGSHPWELAHEFFNTEISPATDGAKGLVFVVILRDPSARYISGYNHFCVRKLQEYNTSSSVCNAPSVLLSANKSVNDPLCSFSAEAKSMGKCASDLLKDGVYWVPLAGWIERFQDARFIFTTFSHYTKDPTTVLAEIRAALGGVEMVTKVHGARQLNEASGNESLATDVAEATAMLDM